MEAGFTEGMTGPSPAQGKGILDLIECKAGGGFSLAEATNYFSHERFI